MKTIQEKALAACIESFAAAQEIKRLKTLIGDSLGKCHVAFRGEAPDDHPLDWTSHLAQAYAFEDEEETQYTEGGRSYLGPAEQMEILSACPHCMTAHAAVQERKRAKKRLANARRAITLIGKSCGEVTA